MSEVDRRSWLATVGLTLGGMAMSRSLVAKPHSPPARTHGDSDVARLALNENPYGPAPSVIPALQREFTHLCRYTDNGLDDLLTLIAAKECIAKDQIVLGEVLEPLGTRLSLQGGPGGEFLYSDPGYTALIDSAVAVSGVAVGVPLDQALRNDLAGLAARINPHTRAVFLVNPHNPTGIVSEPGELAAFAHSLAGRALLIVDEAYLEFADDFAQRTLANLVRAGENVIVFRTFAKAYGLAGLDIGYCLMPRSIAQTLIGQGWNNPHLFNRLAVAAATASLRDSTYIAHVSSRVSEERDKWYQTLRELNARFTVSGGNFVFFETGLSHVDFATSMLKAGVDIGRAFPPYDRWARISIGLPQENARARAAVRNLLQQKR
jgi:histidinol-phosphate aminotransferase